MIFMILIMRNHNKLLWAVQAILLLQHQFQQQKSHKCSEWEPDGDKAGKSFASEMTSATTFWTHDVTTSPTTYINNNKWTEIISSVTGETKPDKCWSLTTLRSNWPVRWIGISKVISFNKQTLKKLTETHTYSYLEIRRKLHKTAW